MSFCMRSPVPVSLCCTQVMYMLHANNIVVNVDWRMKEIYHHLPFDVVV